MNGHVPERPSGEVRELANRIACHFVANSDTSLEEGRAWTVDAITSFLWKPVAPHDGKDGASLIAAERTRQRDKEEWTDYHDDHHKAGDMRDAAEAYLRELRYRPNRLTPGVSPSAPWPWGREYWKPTDDAIRQLTKAGALIAAEIDRLIRAAAGRAEK